VVWQRDGDSSHFGRNVRATSISNFLCGLVTVRQLTGPQHLPILHLAILPCTVQSEAKCTARSCHILQMKLTNPSGISQCKCRQKYFVLKFADGWLRYVHVNWIRGTTIWTISVIPVTFSWWFVVNYGSPTSSPPGCIMRPAATFVNYFYTIKITQFRWLGVPLTVIFPRVAREPAHNKRCGLLPRKGWTPMFVNKVVFPSNGVHSPSSDVHTILYAKEVLKSLF
jgi:hypothetical protein